MKIKQVTTIELEESEMSALQTLKEAHEQCLYNGCYKCEQCPLYINELCIGQYAEMALDSRK